MTARAVVVDDEDLARKRMRTLVAAHEDLEEVRSHLEECTECAHEYDLECIIRSVVRRSCTEKAPDALKVNIMARISQIRVEAGH